MPPYAYSLDISTSSLVYSCSENLMHLSEYNKVLMVVGYSRQTR